MSEKRSLTKREKFLIFFASAVVLFYLAVQFGITPARNKLRTAESTYQTKVTEKVNMERILTSEPGIRTNIGNAEREYAEVIAPIPEEMTSEEMIREFNALLRSVSLSPISVISDKETWTPVAFPDGQTREEIDEETGEEAAYLLIAEVKVEVLGTVAELEALLEAVEDIPYMCVTGITLPLHSEAVIPILFEYTMRNVTEETETIPGETGE
jgi:hypothetical protein